MGQNCKAVRTIEVSRMRNFSRANPYTVCSSASVSRALCPPVGKHIGFSFSVGRPPRGQPLVIPDRFFSLEEASSVTRFFRASSPLPSRNNTPRVYVSPSLLLEPPVPKFRSFYETPLFYTPVVPSPVVQPLPDNPSLCQRPMAMHS